jgi:hypothetical protein
MSSDWEKGRARTSKCMKGYAKKRNRISATNYNHTDGSVACVHA